jgi:hypothetical protein
VVEAEVGEDEAARVAGLRARIAAAATAALTEVGAGRAPRRRDEEIE